MHYKHLDHAFLFEFIGGLLTLCCVFTVGAKGIAVLAALAIRPLVLEISPEPADERIWRLYYESLKWSVLLTAATVLITYSLFDYLPVNSRDRGIVFLTTIPWFMVIHGFAGYMLAWAHRKVIH